jgi:citrate lyase beta subunit
MLVVNPNQIDVSHEVCLPSEEEVNFANEVVKNYEVA